MLKLLYIPLYYAFVDVKKNAHSTSHEVRSADILVHFCYITIGKHYTYTLCQVIELMETFMHLCLLVAHFVDQNAQSLKIMFTWHENLHWYLILIFTTRYTYNWIYLIPCHKTFSIQKRNSDFASLRRVTPFSASRKVDAENVWDFFVWPVQFQPVL